MNCTDPSIIHKIIINVLSIFLYNFLERIESFEENDNLETVCGLLVDSLEKVEIVENIINQIENKGNEVFDDIWSKQLAVRLVIFISLN